MGGHVMIKVTKRYANDSKWYKVKVEGHVNIKYILRNRKGKWNVMYSGKETEVDYTKLKAIVKAAELIRNEGVA